MDEQTGETSNYLGLLAKQFPTIQAVCTEIINLKAILDLPKGTEHFISDLHGEYEAVTHILNNASGVIRDKIDKLYGASVSEEDRSKLATLIYYPERKLEILKRENAENLPEWYHNTLVRLIEISRVVASKYTRSKVRKALPADFAYIIDEVLHADHEKNKAQYYGRIITTIVDIGRADAFIGALAALIKRLAVDHLHVIGDIFDRGPGAEDIMELLMRHHAVDLVWGNHDILWMGAAAGCEACIANVLNVSLSYANVDTIENGYGISLRALMSFAQETYGESMAFKPKVLDEGKIGMSDVGLVAKLRKAAAVMQLKLEGQIIARHPEYDMDERVMLDKIDLAAGTVHIAGVEYPLRDTDFPTIDPEDPCRLSDGERKLLDSLRIRLCAATSCRRTCAFCCASARCTCAITAIFCCTAACRSRRTAALCALSSAQNACGAGACMITATKRCARAFWSHFPKSKSATARTLSGGCGAASIRRFSGACA
jgi:fructose-1,6-bisphosphatase-3